MSTRAILSRQSLVYSQLGGFRNPLELRRFAVRSFKQALMRGTWRTRLARLTGRSTQLQHANVSKKNNARQASLGVQTIVLDDIIGSEGRSSDFDNRFWPLKTKNRDRWVNIAVAINRGIPLPPVELIHTADGYIVRDGHHRLSVARAFGQEVIEAEVV